MTFMSVMHNACTGDALYIGIQSIMQELLKLKNGNKKKAGDYSSLEHNLCCRLFLLLRIIISYNKRVLHKLNFISLDAVKTE